jgi:hypothetical protein
MWRPFRRADGEWGNLESGTGVVRRRSRPDLPADRKGVYPPLALGSFTPTSWRVQPTLFRTAHPRSGTGPAIITPRPAPRPFTSRLGRPAAGLISLPRSAADSILPLRSFIPAGVEPVRLRTNPAPQPPYTPVRALGEMKLLLCFLPCCFATDRTVEVGTNKDQVLR